MSKRIGSVALGAVIGALVFGLTADGAALLVDAGARPVVATVEPADEVAAAPKPVRKAKSACRLIVGWPGCAPRKPPPAPQPQPAPPPVQPAPQEPACDRACLVERRANTPAERPKPEPYEPEFPDDEGSIDLGTLTPEPSG